ncbi:hypothetical protein PITCH_A1590005 [uncultured Desulfobacterium sp.]|uniref:Uncharacterized protein n=1 Tax=uncultured Desulfobacterium sp. TaxID=201089 RepID=A0A445MU04_9BACT|nr:hypothetical protein PITCH_A1590005 [uncultured Desulfobacterium sp.]
MDLKKGFYRFIAKFLVWVMIFQGMPLWQLSQAYDIEFNPDRLNKVVAILASFLSPSTAHAGVAPDANDYTVNRISENFFAISDTGTKLTLADEGGTSGIPIGFNFVYYGTIFTTVTVTANGYLGFSPTISPDNTIIPLADTPNALIAPFWDDLNPGLNPGGGVFFQTIGSAPDRRFIVEWKDVPLKSDPDSRLTFEAVLFEGNNEIQFHYLSMIDGSGMTTSPMVTGQSATIGIENADGGKGNEVAYNKAGSVKSGSAVSFTLAGTAFKTARLLGDLNGDGGVDVQDQFVLTHTIIDARQTRPSLDLVLSDIAPVPASNGGPFGDQAINSSDHSQIFEAVMGRAGLNPTLCISSYYIASPTEVVTFYGSGFDTVAAANNSVVFVGADGSQTPVPAQTVTPDGSQITVTIPSGLQFPCSVMAKRTSLASNSLLFLLEGMPLIANLTPDSGEEGDAIIIRGYEFGANPADNTVRFNGISAVISEVTNTAGMDTLVATVPAGASTGSVTVTVNSNPSNQIAFTYDGPPQVMIASPADNGEISGKVDVIGTASDLKLVTFTLELGLVNEDYSVSYAPIATGTSNVTSGVLGAIDSTLLSNGFYKLRLTAQDQSGKVSSTSRGIVIAGENKPGIFTLNINEMDVPVSGVNITVNRIYDSRMRTSSQDFGRGWHIEVLKEGTYKNNMPPGEGWNTSIGGWIPVCQSTTETVGHETEIRFSDTEFYRFVPVVDTSYAWPLGGGYCEGYFGYQQVGGVPGASLQVLGDNYVLSGGGELVDLDFEVYEPQQVRLTTLNGRQIDLDMQQGVTRIADTNGNALTINNNGVTHSSGKSVSFTRDGQGRITAITDPSGKTITYTYNGDGTLASVTDRNGKTTTYTYDDYLLTEIHDPSGAVPQRNEYDEAGRLIAYVDATGQRTEITTDVNSNTTSVEDKLGNTTTLQYNDKGLITEVTSGGQTKHATYDDSGNKLTETDELGNTTTYTYDANNNLLSKTDPLGHTTSWTYNAKGKVLTETNANGGVTTRTYDASGNLLTVTDALGNTTTFTYDSKGNKLSETDPLGNTTTFEYNTYGNQTKKTDPLGNATTYTYDANGNRLTQTVSRNLGGSTVNETTTFTYDSNGNKLTETDPLGHVKTFAYNHTGHVTSETDANGNTVTQQYDANGNLTRKNFADGTFDVYGYDQENRRTAQTDRAGRTTFFEYDSQGRPTSIRFADNAVQSRGYDAAGRMTSITDPLGNVTQQQFDAAGRRVRTIDSLGNQTEFAFDEVGNQISATDANGNTTSFDYDANNRLLKTIFPDGTFKTTVYDAAGRKISETDQAGKTTEFEYDEMGRLILVTDSLGGVTSYAYDEVGNRITETDANGNTTSYEYDAMGRITKTTRPMGMSETLAYDAVGNMVSKTDFSGATTTYAYDVNNTLVTTNLPGGAVETITYTPTGKRATEVDSRGTTTYEYDTRDRLVRRTDPGGTQIEYAYDLAGNRTEVTTAAGITQYAYDAINRLSRVTDPDGGITNYAYDNVGNRASITYANGDVTTYTYDTLNRLTNITSRKSDTSLIASYTYTLGPAGNRTRVVEGHSGRSVDYTYDALYRLVNEDIADPVNGDSSTAYTYDPVGNRLTMTSGTGTTSYTYDNNNRLLTENGITYSYDANGNMVGRSDSVSTTYAYDGKNRLIEVNDGTNISQYVYDMKGIRVRTTVNGSDITNYLVDNNREFAQVLRETNGSGSELAKYVYGDELLSQSRGAIKSYFLHDGQMSTRTLTNAAGDSTDSYIFDAFGVLLAHTGSTPNQYLYTGQFLDPNSGFYYLRARWMRPETGRFISADTIHGSVFEPQTLHKYIYCLNNPVNRMDPGGNQSLAECMVSVSIVQILVAIAPTVFTGVATAVLIKAFWEPGFAMRYGGLDLIMLGGPEVFVELGFKLYTTGNLLIEVGAALIDLTNALIGIGFAFTGLASTIGSLASAANVIQAIANGVLAATAIADLVSKVGEIGGKLEAIRVAMGGQPANAAPPPQVQQDCSSLKDIVISLVNLAANIASKIQ